MFELGQYVVMPNHLHFIAIIVEPQPVGAACKPPAIKRNKQTIPAIVQAYKASVTRKLGFSLWQRSYWDNIVRSREDHVAIKRYIQNNATWEKDRFYFN